MGFLFASYFVAAVAISLLVFVLWDITRLCEAAVDCLRVGPTNYPRAAIKLAMRQLHVHRRPAASWLDIQIVGQLTSLSSRWIIIPFLALLFVIVFRSVRIDNWSASPALYLTGGILGAVLVHSTYRLQRAAKSLRSVELARLNRYLLQTPPGRRHDCLRAVIAGVENYRVGAFADWTQNPVVGALLTAATALGVAVLNAAVSA